MISSLTYQALAGRPTPQSRGQFVLSYKGLPFVTVWVEYADISIAMQAIGAKPDKRLDGTDVYPIPVLSDPNTGALITDSLKITSYLEKTYPEKPIFPNNSESAIREFNSAHLDQIITPSIKSIWVRSTEIMSPASVKFFTKARSIDIALPWDESYDEDWALLEKGYKNTVYEWYQKTDGKWFMGDTFSYADIVVACYLLWFKRVLKEDEWARISSWNGGKWAQLLADVEKKCKLA
ncbi:hypothetical protein EV424DRAFT_1472288 [Suillus variegatus]|nr:hypothetical protein EV424DRAFT_1472288 [Suillus variegatus]